MCGFTISSQKNVEISEILKCRGPDNFSKIEFDDISFNFARLKIRDLSDKSNQPLVNERYIVSFNGEILNIESLKKQFKISGEFESDTLFLIEYLNKHKDELSLFDSIRGFYSLVVYDKKNKNFLIARDYLGIKPLYLEILDEEFTLSSVPTRKFHKELNSGNINKLITYRFLDYKTKNEIFDGIEIPPGFNKWLSLEEILNFNFINFNNNYENNVFSKFNKIYRKKNTKNLFENIENKLIDAVNINLISDVNIGIFLSGGTDSSLLTALASKEIGNLNTYSIIYKDYKYDESSFQDIISKKFKTNKHTFEETENSYVESFSNASKFSHTPLLIPNYVSLFNLAKEAEKISKVVLTGEGADEIFGGYYVFRDILRYQVLNLIPLINISLSKKYNQQKTFMNDVNKKYLDELLPTSENFNLYDVKSISDVFFHERNNYLKGLLGRADQMTMGNSIEARVPFLDQDLVREVDKLPMNQKVGIRKRKKILHEIASKYLPSEIIERPKIGFSVPIVNWYSQKSELYNLFNEQINNNSSLHELFDKEKVKVILKKAENDPDILENVIFPIVAVGLWL
tara:strand:+ start:6687 stop:8402 length:1716 start_codon:yes stop_codon:yes gene_type:complete